MERKYSMWGNYVPAGVVLDIHTLKLAWNYFCLFFSINLKCYIGKES